MEDLEEDPMYRQNVNIFKDKSAIPLNEEDDDDGLPRVTLAEMLEDMVIDDVEENQPMAAEDE